MLYVWHLTCRARASIIQHRETVTAPIRAADAKGGPDGDVPHGAIAQTRVMPLTQTGLQWASARYILWCKWIGARIKEK